MPSKHTINKLVAEGCAGRFASYVGSVAALEQAGIWQNIEEISASSGGVFLALFGALNMSANEMKNIVDKMDENTVASKTRRSQIPFFGPALSILSKSGINRSDNLIRFAKKVLVERGFSPDLTFKQLAELKKKMPHLKNIHITAVNISKTPAELTVFSSTNPFTQNVKIAEAFAAAVTYPSLLIPMKILINGKYYQFIDGGARDNYPYCIFPRDQWSECLGLKLDTHDEIFAFEDHEPSLADTFFWGLLTDNHFIYKSYPNSIQLFDCYISSFTPPTLIDYQALYISGELATRAWSEKGPAEHKPATCPEEDEHIRARTERYNKLMENDSGISQYIFPLYYFNLLMIYQEIKDWDDEKYGCCAYYNALLQQLNQWRCWSLSDFVLTGSALIKVQSNLFKLLQERCEKAALLPDATPNLITDLILTHLQKNEYNKACALLLKLDAAPNAEYKLMHINHRRILQLLDKSKNSSPEKKQLIKLISKYREMLLMTHPGAYEGYLISKFGALLQIKQYPEAAIIAKKLLETPTLTDQQRENIYDASMQLFGETSEQGIQLREIFPVTKKVMEQRCYAS